ncbi:MAG: succinate dehydrogenase, partial [Acidobacteriota bacterium]
NSTFASRWMFFNGSIVFIFLVVHMNSFFVPARFDISKPSMYELVRRAFESPLYAGFYLVALVLLGYHLRQGFQSAFQTFGLRPRWLKPIELVSIVFWLVIPLMFASMPIYFLWLHMTGGN